MEAILASIPHTGSGWIFFIAALLAAGFTAYLVYNRNKDGSDDRLIGILKETVDALEKKVDDQKREHDETVGTLTKKIDNLTKKVDDLERENGTLIEVLQGRDKATLDFQKQMLETVKISMETNGLAKESHQKISELIEIMGKHLEIVGKRQDQEREDRQAA